MRGQLYRGHANATALFSSPVVSALGSESDDPGSSPGRGKALCPWDVRETKFFIIPDLVCQFTYYNLFLLHSNLYHLMNAYSCFNSISISRLLSDFTVSLQMDSVFLFVFSFWLVSR